MPVTIQIICPNEKIAKAFMSWYSNSGEQDFDMCCEDNYNFDVSTESEDHDKFIFVLKEWNKNED